MLLTLFAPKSFMLYPICVEKTKIIFYIKMWKFNLKGLPPLTPFSLFSNLSSILLSGLSSKRRSDHNHSNAWRVTHWKLFIMAAEALSNPNTSASSLTTLPTPPPPDRSWSSTPHSPYPFPMTPSPMLFPASRTTIPHTLVWGNCPPFSSTFLESQSFHWLLVNHWIPSCGCQWHFLAACMASVL